MNLKIFHAVFIAFAIALLMFLGWFHWSAFQETGEEVSQRAAWWFFGGAAALCLYEGWFFWKTRKLIIG